MKLNSLLEVKARLFKKEFLHLQQLLSPFDTIISKCSLSLDETLELTLSYEYKSFKTNVKFSIEEEEHFSYPVIRTYSPLKGMSEIIKELKNDDTMVIVADEVKTLLIKAFINHLFQQDSKASFTIGFEATTNEHFEEVESAMADKKLSGESVDNNKLDEARRRLEAAGSKILIEFANMNKTALLIQTAHASN